MPRTPLALAFALVLLAAAVPAPAGTLLAPGTAFPEWTLADHAGKNVSSKDLRGKTYLLWFYPKAGTPGCTIEGHRLRDRHPDFAALGVEVLGVSFDTPADNAAFVQEEDFPFRLLSDSDRALATAVGAVTQSAQRHPSRISYLVGGDGTVLKAYDSVTPAAHADEVLADLRALGK